MVHAACVLGCCHGQQIVALKVSWRRTAMSCRFAVILTLQLNLWRTGLPNVIGLINLPAKSLLEVTQDTHQQLCEIIVSQGSETYFMFFFSPNQVHVQSPGEVFERSRSWRDRKSNHCRSNPRRGAQTSSTFGRLGIGWWGSWHHVSSSLLHSGEGVDKNVLPLHGHAVLAASATVSAGQPPLLKTIKIWCNNHRLIAAGIGWICDWDPGLQIINSKFETMNHSPWELKLLFLVARSFQTIYATKIPIDGAADLLVQNRSALDAGYWHVITHFELL